MKFTNRFGYPESIADALRRSDEDYDPGHADISVTGLISPPMIVQLRKRHADELEEDVSQQLWRLLGTSCHYVIEKSTAAAETLFEERLYLKVAGWIVSGKLDLICRDGWVNDYKVTSVYSFLLGHKPEWEQQLNAYDALARANGHEAPAGLRIIGILRDWTQSEKLRNPSQYPDAPLRIKEIPRWEPEEQIQWIASRVELHQRYNALPIQDVPVCTEEERWQDPPKYAVMKSGNQRATRVFDTEAAAEEFIEQQSKPEAFEVSYRPSVPRRCVGYCDVARFCPYGKIAIEEHQTK